MAVPPPSRSWSRRAAAGLVALLALAWLAYLLVGDALVAGVVERFGAPLAALGDGKFDRTDVFVDGRLREALVLATLAGGFLAADLALWPLVKRWLDGRPLGWVLPAAVGVAQVNAVAAVASGTALLWLGLWSGGETSHPRVPFEIKAQLAAEAAAPRRVVLLGNSQAATQVDEAPLARALGPRAWVTELSYEGVSPVDLLLVQRRLRTLRPDVAVVYLSELSLYHGVESARFAGFADGGGRRDLDRLGVTALGRDDVASALWYARVARALPLFALREPVADRLLGRAAGGLAQTQYDVDLEPDLDARAARTAASFTAPDAPEARLQKRALASFVARAEAQGTQVVLLAGMLSPRLTRRLAPSLRADFLATLDALAQRHANVQVIGPAAMPASPEASFEDLTHVDEAEKARGTRVLLPALVAAVDRALSAAPAAAR